MQQQKQQQPENTQLVRSADRNKLGVVSRELVKPKRVNILDRWLLRKMSALVGHPPSSPHFGMGLNTCTRPNYPLLHT